MIQSSMLATFPAIPAEKLPKVVEALNTQGMKLGSGITFMRAVQDGREILRAQIVTSDFASAEKMSDKVEELLTKLGGIVDDRVIAGEVF